MAGPLKGHYYTDKGPFRKLKYVRGPDYVTLNTAQRLWGEYLFAQLFFIIIIIVVFFISQRALQNSYREQKKYTVPIYTLHTIYNVI